MLIQKFRSTSLLVAGAVLGVVTAAAVGTAFAASNGSGSSTSSAPSASYGSAGSSAGPARDGDGPKGGPGGKGGHAGEKALTGADLAKATAAAKQAVSGGTVDRAETDSGDAAYEVHMTKSDQTKVTVKLDKSFAVTAVEDGMGR